MEHKESGKVIITVESKPTLKIKSMIIEGQYETYEKGSEGVKTKNIIVKDTKDLADYKESVGKEYTRRKQELLDKLEEVKTEIEQLENKASKNFGIIEEIEQIFNM
jgi:predicted RNase H-like nuclease (RuvC/YqgF family)